MNPVRFLYDYWRLGRLLKAKARIDARWQRWLHSLDDRLDVFPED